MKRTSPLPFDATLLAATAGLVVIGILFIYSSGHSGGQGGSSPIPEGPGTGEHVRQIIWAVTGIAAMILAARSSCTRMRELSPYLYAAGLAVLVLTLLGGRQVRGARSWLGVGILGIQPSELCKVTTALLLGRYLAGIGGAIRELPRFLLALAIPAIPMGLILLQPDAGTAAVYLPVFLAMSFMAGARKRHLLFLAASLSLGVALSVLPTYGRWIMGRYAPLLELIARPELLGYLAGGLGIVAALAAWGARASGRGSFYWTMYVAAVAAVACVIALGVGVVIREYQMMRLIAFLDPRVDPRGAGWNTIQSLTAVGSGGLTGKGFLQGTQSQYRFLPQQSTDFIFSVIAEEWGFLGGLAVCGMYLIILLRGLQIAYRAGDDFGRYISAGFVGMLGAHMLVNVGMSLGIMPITGIPLIFVSYGGSSLWAGLIAVGLLLGVHRQGVRRG